MLDTLVHIVTIAFHLLCWWFIVGPILIVAPAFKISYLGVDKQYATTKKEKAIIYSQYFLCWTSVVVWVLGFIGLICYHSGVFK